VRALGELFGFDGRINRLGYLWRMLLTALLLFGIALVTTLLVMFVIRPTGVEDLFVWIQRLSVGFALLGLWAGVGLASRRLRDMGFEPAHIVPIYAALWVVNMTLLRPMARLDPTDYALPEWGWEGFQYLVILPLLLWPGRPRTEPAAPAEYAHPEPTAYLNWRD
jgi:uncharacterized membrane protein YhaH (DUF805 family)